MKPSYNVIVRIPHKTNNCELITINLKKIKFVHKVLINSSAEKQPLKKCFKYQFMKSWSDFKYNKYNDLKENCIKCGFQKFKNGKRKVVPLIKF